MVLGVWRVGVFSDPLTLGLAPLIPPPRAPQVRFHGVLARCASRQDRVVPAGDGAEETTPSC